MGSGKTLKLDFVEMADTKKDELDLGERTNFYWNLNKGWLCILFAVLAYINWHDKHARRDYAQVMEPCLYRQGTEDGRLGYNYENARFQCGDMSELQPEGRDY